MCLIPRNIKAARWSSGGIGLVTPRPGDLAYVLCIFQKIQSVNASMKVSTPSTSRQPVNRSTIANPSASSYGMEIASVGSLWTLVGACTVLDPSFGQAPSVGQSHVITVPFWNCQATARISFRLQSATKSNPDTVWVGKRDRRPFFQLRNTTRF